MKEVEEDVGDVRRELVRDDWKVGVDRREGV